MWVSLSGQIIRVVEAKNLLGIKVSDAVPEILSILADAKELCRRDS